MTSITITTSNSGVQVDGQTITQWVQNWSTSGSISTGPTGSPTPTLDRGGGSMYFITASQSSDTQIFNVPLGEAVVLSISLVNDSGVGYLTNATYRLDGSDSVTNLTVDSSGGVSVEMNGTVGGAELIFGQIGNTSPQHSGAPEAFLVFTGLSAGQHTLTTSESYSSTYSSTESSTHTDIINMVLPT